MNKEIIKLLKEVIKMCDQSQPPSYATGILAGRASLAKQLLDMMGIDN